MCARQVRARRFLALEFQVSRKIFVHSSSDQIFFVLLHLDFVQLLATFTFSAVPFHPLVAKMTVPDDEKEFIDQILVEHNTRRQRVSVHAKKINYFLSLECSSLSFKVVRMKLYKRLYITLELKFCKFLFSQKLCICVSTNCKIVMCTSDMNVTVLIY